MTGIFFCALFAALGRYQSIVDRMPFGAPPPNFDPTAMPGQPGAGGAGAGDESGEMTEEQRTEEEQKLAATIRVSVLNVTPSGAVAVGFTDSSVQPVEHYYMLVGQERKGWKIESADPGERSATISKDGISVTLKLGEGTGGEQQGKKAASHRGIRGGRIGGAMRMADGSGGAPAPMGGGAMSLLRARRAQEEARAAAENRRREEAEAAAKRDREERAAIEAEKAEIAKRDAEEAAKERAAMQEQLRNISEQLKLKREEDERKKAEAGETEDDTE